MSSSQLAPVVPLHQLSPSRQQSPRNVPELFIVNGDVPGLQDAGELSCVLLARHMRWMERARGRLPSTIHGRELAILRLARWLRTHRGVEDPVLAGRDDLTAWQLELRGERGFWAAETSHVAQYYKWLYAEGQIDADPAALLDRPTIPKSKPKPVPAEVAEQVYTAAAEHHDLRIMRALLLAGFAGLRCCEIVRLRREDLWVEDDGIPRLRVVGKGGDEEVIPIDPVLLEALERYGMPRHGHVIPRLDNRAGPTSRQQISGLVSRLIRRQGIEFWSAHNWRHRFGTKTYRLCKDLLLTGALMRHKSTISTKGYVEVNALEGVDVMHQLAADLPGYAAVHDLAARRERRRAAHHGEGPDCR